MKFKKIKINIGQGYSMPMVFRVAILGFLFCVLIIIFHFWNGSIFPSTGPGILIFSSLIMLSFVILFVEHFFTKPTDVLSNSIAILLLLSPLKIELGRISFWFGIFFYYILILALISLASILLYNLKKSEESKINIIATYLKKFAITFGSGKFLFFILFFLTLIFYVNSQSQYFIILFIYATIILLINPKNFLISLIYDKNKKDNDKIGEIFGIQSKKIFLVKIFENVKSINKFDVVKFRYLMQDARDYVTTGIVFDTYLLNKERWVKILQLKEPSKEETLLEKNVVYKLSGEEEIKTLEKEIRIDDFVGIIIDGSNIAKIKFEYSKKKDDLQEGDLLELMIGKRKIFYQVLDGTTKIDELENRNETGFINGEAMQLGEWCSEKLSFQKFGWVPSINTPIFKADTSKLTVGNFDYPQYKLGVVPGTTLPSVIDLSKAVSHHIALLGVTGCGKSFLAQKIIEQLLIDTKVICIDFTGEWKRRLDVTKYKTINKEGIGIYLDGDDKKIGIFELPSLSNTTDVLKETQLFLEEVFSFAKIKYDQESQFRVVLVLEEAHTITPETSFLGDMGDYQSNKALVNKMTQIALQGRKYGVGLLVIAQRTANVSKTVLTQCNTVICFQAFDETSFAFLGNYVGKDMLQALPNLKQYHAVVAGKAIESNIPMIIDLTRDDPSTSA